MKTNPLVSIIVPVYNVEKYLERCLNSILSQTYRNLEIIIVDDGSTDTSPTILHSYHDPRLIIITKENGGQSSARNEGLKLATGKYVTFVDSDDWIHQNAIHTMVLTAEKFGADIVDVSYKVIHEGKGAFNYPRKKTKIKAYDGDDCCKQLYLSHVSNFVWAKLYLKSKMFDDGIIRFPENRIYEDAAIMYKFMQRCRILVTLRGASFYYYFMRSNSSSHTRNLNHANDILTLIKELSLFCTNSPYWGVFCSKFLYGAYVYYLRLPKDIRQTQNSQYLIEEIKRLNHVFPIKCPWYKYIFTPSAYKVVLWKTGLVKIIKFLYK